MKQPGEFELIARLCGGLSYGYRTVLGVGDDCAILSPSRRRQLFTIDSMVEGVHFELEWFKPSSLGARALTVNLSDIAAMGGSARTCVVNLGIRPELQASFFDRLYQGLLRTASQAGLDVVGGNITRAAQLTITIAVLGEAGAAAMRRDSAREGDQIFVTGTLGDSALGWRILAGKLQANAAARKFLTARFVSPTARLTAGQRLARIKPTPAAIDISDGLLQDLDHVLLRSGVGAELDLASIPLSEAYRAVSPNNLDLALSGGEDYELLFCLRPGYGERQLSRRLGLPVRRIGRIVNRRQGLKLRDTSGRLIASTGRRGWDQLGEDRGR